MPRRIIIDTDPGTDDAIALLLAFGSPELDLAAITVVGGNVGLERTLANACAIATFGGSAAPVFGGVDRALLGGFTSAAHIHGESGLAGADLPPGRAAEAEHAVDALRRLLREAPATLVGIGPATNLALALATEPTLASQVEEIVLMTGAWTEGNITASAEFNAYCDPEALAILLDSGRPVTLATLDLTAQAQITPARIAAMRAAGGRCAIVAADILAATPPTPRLPEHFPPLHDPCAVAWLIEPGLFTTRRCHARVELAGPARGRTLIDRWGRDGGAPNVALLERVDAEGFYGLLTTRIGKLE